MAEEPETRPAEFPALYIYPLNGTFAPKRIPLLHNQRVRLGRQTNTKSTPGERNGYFDSKVLSRQHAEVWEEKGKIFIGDTKSSNGTSVNGERLSPEGLQSDPYELKSDDVVELGFDIVGQDNTTVLHRKIAARVRCILSEQDIQVAATAEQHQIQHSSIQQQEQLSGPSGSRLVFPDHHGEEDAPKELGKAKRHGKEAVRESVEAHRQQQQDLFRLEADQMVMAEEPEVRPAGFPALHLYSMNESFATKRISLLHNQRVRLGRQTNAKSTPGERNGYFDSKVLSRQHAEVWEEGGKIFIGDTKSSNGTFVNGERLSPEGLQSDPYELKSDDVVELGLNIVGEDNKTIIHHKIAARVLCIISEQDFQMAARATQDQVQHSEQSNEGNAGEDSQEAAVAPVTTRSSTL
ncbi:hypothetical protein V5O48_008167 [Marasmius crinis-equi]|uniref:FHA domain-containing protein n=1 Tax=Marasmius crinis-equi TaxID=585013 RepID=A0ABR3FEK9_9AGAR